ncbi:MAG: hypothetical protein ACYCW6_19055 [Candidatus Xenobia bacterium]
MDSVSGEIRQASTIPGASPQSPFTNPTPIPSPWPNPTPQPSVYSYLQFTELKPPAMVGGAPVFLNPNAGNYQVVTYYTVADPATNRFYEVLRAVYDPGVNVPTAGAPFPAPNNGAIVDNQFVVSFPPSTSPQPPYNAPPGGWSLLSLSSIAGSTAGQVSLQVIPTYTDCVSVTILSNEDPMSEPITTDANNLNTPWTWRYTDELDCKQVTALY